MELDLTLIGDLPFDQSEKHETGVEVLPKTIYEKATNQKAEEFLPKLLGEKLFEEVAHEATHRGVSPMTFLRQESAYRLQLGEFIPKPSTEPGDKRTKDDEDESKQPALKTIMRMPTFGIIRTSAKIASISNVAFVRQLAQFIVDKATQESGNTFKTKRELIEDSKKKDAAIAKHIENEKYKLYGI